MSSPQAAAILRLLPAHSPSARGARYREPVTVGVPLPSGAVSHLSTLTLRKSDGTPLVSQTRELERWPDGTVRWMLLDYEATCGADESPEYYLTADGEPASPPDSVALDATHDGIRITTGSTTFSIERGQPFPISAVAAARGDVIISSGTGLHTTTNGKTDSWTVAEVKVIAMGPIRTEIHVTGSPAAGADSTPLAASARIEIFSSTPAARVHLTLRNRRRAKHPRGQWPLGDAGSVFLDSATVHLRLAGAASSVQVATAPRSTAVMSTKPPVVLLQASSGGNHWLSRTHVNRDGAVRLPFRGYRLRTPEGTLSGDRATPIVTVGTPPADVHVAVPDFWQNFPRAIETNDSSISIGLLPDGAGDVHELQGGEQKTHVFVVACGPDPVSDLPLAWCHCPQRFRPTFDDSIRAGAIPGIRRPSGDPHPGYTALCAVALDADRGFFAKRETADEYGWRNFGDTPADHESAFQPKDRPFVSHYNNQYDAVAGFAFQFLRTGNPRWWELMDDLAKHVRDIDVYHTDEDKAAYNHGLFWHTNHYVDAATSTHRTYPASGSAGGGPSAEHNYNLGLMLHYFLTGDPLSRETAVALGQWVIDMDDGGLTPFRWLSRANTGHASWTFNHHLPGRGAGHSILACVVAHRLSGNPAFLRKAEELIARCIHPDEPPPMAFVENIEAYWSYTAFLQALGQYLEHKRDLGEIDHAFDHAQRSLLSFVRWMAVHERPYLERRHLLEYPTETWVAQDFRKADAFFWAACHASGQERDTFLQQARRYFDYATTTLPTMQGYWYTRPLVLTLTQGVRAAFLHTDTTWLPSALTTEPAVVPAYQPFRSQKEAAMRRALVFCALAGLCGLVGIVSCLGRMLR